MKIQIASDLHLEYLEKRFPDYRVIEPAAADLLVIAGDIHRGAMAIEAFADWPVPVLYVHGNHEAYREEYGSLIASLRAKSSGSNVSFLERDELVWEGVRFLGCCLWTDYRVTEATPADAMAEAGRLLPDHNEIRMGERKFEPADALQIHNASRDWLKERLATPFDGPTVVISHHGPHPQSVHPRFAGSNLNAAFVSDLTSLIERTDLWIHGHVHDSFDYTIGKSRVVANPRGYAGNLRTAPSIAQLQWENPAFDPSCVIELSRR